MLQTDQRPGVYERSSSKQRGFKNPGYYAFKDKEQAESEASIHFAHWSPSVVGSVAMWGEVMNMNMAGGLNMPPFGRSPKLLETLAF